MVLPVKVELIVRLFVTMVLAVTLFRPRLFVQSCRPLVLTVKTYPWVTNEPSVLYDVVFRRDKLLKSPEDIVSIY